MAAALTWSNPECGRSWSHVALYKCTSSAGIQSCPHICSDNSARPLSCKKKRIIESLPCQLLDSGSNAECCIERPFRSKSKNDWAEKLRKIHTAVLRRVCMRYTKRFVAVRTFSTLDATFKTDVVVNHNRL